MRSHWAGPQSPAADPVLPQSSIMVELIHSDPLSAWNYLREHGGIELEGRDEGLDQRILERLDPVAPSLHEALAAATMEAFARAFFTAIAPFVAMFRDILDFFEHADATKGQDQWTLRLDEVDVDLEHFRKWLRTWIEIANVTLQIPAIDGNTRRTGSSA